jgi:hypothetical protein
MTTTTQAVTAYNTLKQKNGFNAPAARLFVILNDNDLQIVSHYGDVYEALSAAPEILAPMKDIRYLGVDTCGWAAPVNDDMGDEMPPSAHPERRRCRLVCVVDRNLSSASCIGFEDDPDNLVTDDGKAVGSLADAVTTAMGALAYIQAAAN